MDVENLKMLVSDILTEESYQGCFSTTSFSHDDDWDFSLHSQVDHNHFEEIVSRYDII